MPSFSPPTVADVPRVAADTPPYVAFLARLYTPLVRGRSVLKEGGVYVTVDSPDANRIAAAQEVYMGGHVYEVSGATAAALTAAGYTVL